MGYNRIPDDLDYGILGSLSKDLFGESSGTPVRHK